MIYDKIENIGKYRGMSEWLDQAITFIQETDLTKLASGKTPICGDKVFANVMETEAVHPEAVSYEIHRRYMDIQIDIEGTERLLIGADADTPAKDFDEEKDFGTVVCSESAACTLGAGHFVICMAMEPHKPSLCASFDLHLKKCVIKVAVK